MKKKPSLPLSPLPARRLDEPNPAFSGEFSHHAARLQSVMAEAEALIREEREKRARHFEDQARGVGGGDTLSGEAPPPSLPSERAARGPGSGQPSLTDEEVTVAIAAIQSGGATVAGLARSHGYRNYGNFLERIARWALKNCDCWNRPSSEKH